MKKVVYTAIFGDKDDLKHIDRSEGIDYIVFTDNPMLRNDDFKTIVCPVAFEDPVRNAKFYKILPNRIFPEYDYSMWIDGSISINGIDVNVLFDNYLKDHDIAFHKHPHRNCIYDEAEVCIQHNKDKPSVIRKQMAKYKSAGYPKNNGLISGGIIFRRHSHKISRLNESWWKEIMNHSRRDQLSFNYIAEIGGYEHRVLDGHVRNNNVRGFKLHRHNLKDFRNW